jgi:disulfide bond formation protein DsbB
VNVQVSPDGQWWWNGQSWNPVGVYAPAVPARPPGALIAVIGLNLAGAALILLLGVLILIIGQRPEFQQQLANDASITSIGPTTFVLVLGLVLIGYGVFLAVVNSLLGWYMVKRHAWGGSRPSSCWVWAS